MSRSDRLEAKDPFLADYKQNLQDVIKGMKKVGPSGLQLLVQEMIRSRWIKDRRATYPYEVAWVFDRREEAISGIVKTSEEGRLIGTQRVGDPILSLNYCFIIRSVSSI